MVNQIFKSIAASCSRRGTYNLEAKYPHHPIISHIARNISFAMFTVKQTSLIAKSLIWKLRKNEFRLTFYSLSAFMLNTHSGYKRIFYVFYRIETD